MAVALDCMCLYRLPFAMLLYKVDIVTAFYVVVIAKFCLLDLLVYSSLENCRRKCDYRTVVVDVVLVVYCCCCKVMSTFLNTISSITERIITEARSSYAKFHF